MEDTFAFVPHYHRWKLARFINDLNPDDQELTKLISKFSSTWSLKIWQCPELVPQASKHIPVWLRTKSGDQVIHCIRNSLENSFMSTSARSWSKILGKKKWKYVYAELEDKISEKSLPQQWIQKKDMSAKSVQSFRVYA